MSVLTTLASTTTLCVVVDASPLLPEPGSVVTSPLLPEPGSVVTSALLPGLVVTSPLLPGSVVTSPLLPDLVVASAWLPGLVVASALLPDLVVIVLPEDASTLPAAVVLLSEIFVVDFSAAGVVRVVTAALVVLVLQSGSF